MKHSKGCPPSTPVTPPPITDQKRPPRRNSARSQESLIADMKNLKGVTLKELGNMLAALHNNREQTMKAEKRKLKDIMESLKSYKQNLTETQHYGPQELQNFKTGLKELESNLFGMINDSRKELKRLGEEQVDLEESIHDTALHITEWRYEKPS